MQDNSIIASEEEDLGTVSHWTYTPSIVREAETRKLKGKEVYTLDAITVQRVFKVHPIQWFVQNETFGNNGHIWYYTFIFVFGIRMSYPIFLLALGFDNFGRS